MRKKIKGKSKFLILSFSLLPLAGFTQDIKQLTYAEKTTASSEEAKNVYLSCSESIDIRQTIQVPSGAREVQNMSGCNMEYLIYNMENKLVKDDYLAPYTSISFKWSDVLRIEIRCGAASCQPSDNKIHVRFYE